MQCDYIVFTAACYLCQMGMFDVRVASCELRVRLGWTSRRKKAAEGRRSPRRQATPEGAIEFRGSVLECVQSSGALGLWGVV
jgi:hypothetical protein